MIHLNVLVEGKTELLFVKNVLAVHLGALDVFAYPVAVMTSKDNRTSREYRGGVLSYRQVRADLLRLIKRYQHNSKAWFTTMIDMVCVPEDFPGYEEARRIAAARERVTFLERKFAEDVDCHRFLPYLQLHEYEALLFADPARMSEFYSEARFEESIRHLVDLVAERAPEEIDDGAETAPSKRIIREIPEYEGDKALAGPSVAAAIGVTLLRQRCPHFGEWLARLEALGSLEPR